MTEKGKKTKNEAMKEELDAKKSYGTKIFEDEHFKKIENPFISSFNEQLPRQIIFIAIIVVLIIFFFLNLSSIAAFFKKIIDILIPIILGWVLAFIMAPLFNICVKKFSESKDKTLNKFSKPIATIVCAIALIAAFVGLVFLFVPQLYISITSFIGKSSDYIDRIRSFTDELKMNSNTSITKNILSQVETLISSIGSSTSSPDISQYFGSIFSGFYASFKAILNVFVAFVVMIYSLNMKEELTNGLKRILHAILRKDIARKIIVEARFTKTVFSEFIFGKFVDSLIIGIICYVCCAIMQMPYTPLIAVIVGITNIIPFFGPFIGAIPSFLIILLDNPLSWKPYGFLVFILILQQVDGNIIGPKILGDRTGVGSFWVLFSILLFGGLFGFVGMVIAVPMWAVITRLFDQFVIVQLKKKEYPLSVDDYQRLKEYNKELTDSANKG